MTQVFADNSTRPDTSVSNEDYLKPVIGTVVSVLMILIAVIIVAFCRPKLKNIKRRWRELREDEVSSLGILWIEPNISLKIFILCIYYT